MTLQRVETDELDLWEWAWTQYQNIARNLPDCEHVRAWKDYLYHARRIQIIGLRMQDKKRAGRQKEPVPRTREQVKVVAVSELTDEMFVRHFNARHDDSVPTDMRELPYPIDYNVWQLYVGFHYRLHETQSGLDHYHEEDKIEDRVDRAIEALIDRAWRGWFEIAGIDGHVAVFPGEDIATRVNGVVEHHHTIEDATDRLLTPVAKKKAKSRK